MHPAVLAALVCPHDGQGLQQDARSLACAAGHRFDLARQGYATLIRRPLAHSGDPAPMIERRLRVHGADLLGAVHTAVVAAARAAALPPGIVCDLGAGPGTYLAAVLDAREDRAGLAIDVSKAAARRAARCHQRAASIVADVWDGLPVATGSVALLLDVFAPRPAEELARVVAPGGTLLVVTPLPDHLAELRGPFDLLDVAEDKAASLPDRLGPAFTEVARDRVEDVVEVRASQAADLAGMGPSGHHLDVGALEAAARELPAASEVRVAVTLSRFVRREVRGGAGSLTR